MVDTRSDRRQEGHRQCLAPGCRGVGIIFEIPICESHYKALSKDEKATAALGYVPGKPMRDSVRSLVRGYLT